MRRLLAKAIPFVVLLLFTVPAFWAIVTPGYFPVHDATQVERVAQMAQALADGAFPVRWVKDLGYGYGYPLFNFYNPLPYYVGAVVMTVGINAVGATKFMFVVPIIGAAVAMYVLARKYLGELPALAASTLYTYAPYHAVQIYVRGAVAEYWAYAFIPLVIYGLLEGRKILAATALAGLVLSHNLTALMAVDLLGLLFLLQLIKEKDKRLVVKRYLAIAALGLGLSAFFWLPSLTEKQFTSVDQMVTEAFNPLEHFVFPRQLWYSPWGFGGSAPGEHDGLSFMLGKVHILLALTAIVFWLIAMTKSHPFDPFDKLRASKSKVLFVFSFLLLAFSLLMMLPTSRVVWERVSLFDYLQFPWRYLSFASLATSLLAACTVHDVYRFAIKKIPSKVLVTISYVVLIIFVWFSFTRYFQPQFKFGGDVTAETLLTEERVKFEVSARSDEYRPMGSQRLESVDSIPKGRFEIQREEGDETLVLEDKTQTLALETTLGRPKPLLFNVYAFPGWLVTIDGKRVETREFGSKRLLQVQVPEGTHLIQATFSNTPIRTVGNSLALLSLGVMGMVTIISRKRGKVA